MKKRKGKGKRKEEYRVPRRIMHAKNITNNLYYKQAIQELKEDCNAHSEEYSFDVPQTMKNFKRCIQECRKITSEVKRFQENKYIVPGLESYIH